MNTTEREYLLKCREIAQKLQSQSFPIDKIYRIIGREDAVNFRFARGICNLKNLQKVVELNSEKKSETGFKYKKKEGVIKMRVNKALLADLVIMNYDIRLMTHTLPSAAELLMKDEVRASIPDLGKRKRIVDMFLSHSCDGVNNIELFKLLFKICEKKEY